MQFCCGQLVLAGFIVFLRVSNQTSAVSDSVVVISVPTPRLMTPFGARVVQIILTLTNLFLFKTDSLLNINVQQEPPGQEVGGLVDEQHKTLFLFPHVSLTGCPGSDRPCNLWTWISKAAGRK